jgi:hypothetical protein
VLDQAVLMGKVVVVAVGLSAVQVVVLVPAVAVAPVLEI